MTGRNIKVPGHALKKSDPKNPLKWECYCGAWGVAIDDRLDYDPVRSRRNEHDAHKIEVLRSQGKLDEEEE